MPSIIQHGGLYSWADCEEKKISIAKPGGSHSSHSLDRRDGLQHYVRVCFVTQHPMMYAAMNEGRISNPILLEIDPQVIYWKDSKYSDRNATKNGAYVGSDIDCFKSIHFSAVKVDKHFDLDDEEQKFYQAEVLVKHFIPLEYIKNVGDFGFQIPNKPQPSIYTRTTYNTPAAFIFLVNQSIGMQKTTTLFGKKMTMAEAAAQIVNRQINELVLRCIKPSEVCHYYDIAMIGYGKNAYSGWIGDLEGMDFVSPEELRRHPYKKIISCEKKRIRKGVTLKDVEKAQWIEARHDSDEYPIDLHEVLKYAERLIKQWTKKHRGKIYCPITIINITDNIFNELLPIVTHQYANKWKSLFNNNDNVILFNIHFSANKLTEEVEQSFWLSRPDNNHHTNTPFNMSSILREGFNTDIIRCLNDNRMGRYSAMSINADIPKLQLNGQTPSISGKMNIFAM